MNENIGFAERRQHKRSGVKQIVVGVLKSTSPEIIGSITDISLSGVKFTYNELKNAPPKESFQSIDLIADANYLYDIPCDCAWNRVVTEFDSELRTLRQYGIQFGKLTPWQLLLLKNIIDECVYLNDPNITANANKTQDSTKNGYYQTDS